MATNKKTTKTNKKVKTTQTKKEVLEDFSSPSIASVIKYIIVVLAIFGIMYLVTVLILKKSSLDYISKEPRKTSIQYSEILAGTSFSKKNNEYLVLFYDMNGDDASTYDKLYSNYMAKEEHLPIYYVNLGSALNKEVISKESNKEAASAEDLKINGATLIRFVDNKIEEYFEGEDQIKDYFKD